MKTIIIEPQQSAEALAAAVTANLCEKFGVEANENGTVAPFSGSGIGFQAAASGASTVILKVTNAHGQTVNPGSVSFSNTFIYALDIYLSRGATAVAVTLRINNQSFSPAGVIAKNGFGECVGLVLTSNSVSYVRENENGTVKSYAAANVYTVNNPAFSLVRFPDFISGTMFDEVYIVLSAPTTITPGMIIHAGENDFVPIRSSSTALAIPIN